MKVLLRAVPRGAPQYRARRQLIKWLVDPTDNGEKTEPWNIDEARNHIGDCVVYCPQTGAPDNGGDNCENCGQEN